MDWRDYIHSNPEVLRGKPVVKGTRLAVDFILGLFAAGWSEEQVLENYPTLTKESLKAVFAFAAECIGESHIDVLRRHERHSVLELRGLGKEIWSDIDAQDYVNSERASWSG